MLNEKQTRFAHAYVACGGNGRAAAIQAGYSPSSAAKRACELLKHPDVQDCFFGCLSERFQCFVGILS